MPKIQPQEIEELIEDEIGPNEIERLRRKEIVQEKKRQLQKEYQQKKRARYRI